MNTALKNYRDSLTQEQKDNLLVQARAARIEKEATKKANEHLYKLSYMDSPHWITLSQRFNVRMPAYNEPCTPTWMRKYLNRCGIGHRDWMDSCGFEKLESFINLNPKITLFGFVGNVLEYKNDLVQNGAVAV